MTIHFLWTTAVLCLLLVNAALAQEGSSTPNSVFRIDRINALVAVAVFSAAVLLYTRWARGGRKLFIRKIAGLDAV